MKPKLKCSQKLVSLVAYSLLLKVWLHAACY